MYNRFVVKVITKIITVAAIFSLFASIYQILEAKKKISQERQSVLTVDFAHHPELMLSGQSETFAYHVEAPPSFTTTSTAIYYSYDSTPSALTKFDSPDAVRYPNYTEDYFVGPFKLPDTFDLNLSFPHPGTIYYRAYAKVGNDHLWTNENKLEVK